MKNSDYEKAKKYGLTSIDRWECGKDHHPASIRLMKFLSEHDYKDFADCFNWKMGGDGDNGETLMYQMDAFFELMDKEGWTSIKEIVKYGCGNHGCKFVTPKGQGTNGPCTCVYKIKLIFKEK